MCGQAICRGSHGSDLEKHGEIVVDAIFGVKWFPKRHFYRYLHDNDQKTTLTVNLQSYSCAASRRHEWPKKSEA